MDANEIKRLILNLLREAEVIAVDHRAGKCRVATGELQSNWVRWFTLTAGDTVDWHPVTLGEQGLLLCVGGDPAQGVFLRGIYSDDNPAPSDLPSLHTCHYPDGAVVQYDHETHALDATLPDGGTVNIVSPQAVTVKTTDALIEAETWTVKTGQGTVDGPLTVKGPFKFEAGMSGKGGDGGKAVVIDGGADFTQDVTAAGKSVAGHDHTETGSVTSKPR
ncbi:phage baseplate assembly protein V [Cupriavidus sp. UGS-1]|uniref:phage baseplate assembly protein V n=1 Tax=Cupriavidus sp. UGS-1 TaxID=2899826 RepID=UPI001E585B6E|nr:phage baseplate assembly protein V [Cupriavidus sp. UGS-1]MCD9124034.1 phage baseplate assembly protein V [Cupriavidus sp. UGS-1]